MTWAIETLISEVIATIKAGVPAFQSVAEPGEALPQAAPFCLVEHLGGPVDLGNLEEWHHAIRFTVGVHRKGGIDRERKAVRGYLLDVMTVLRANAILGADAAALTAEAEATGAQMMQYGDPAQAFLGATLTVTYQTSEGVAHLVSD